MRACYTLGGMRIRPSRPVALFVAALAVTGISLTACSSSSDAGGASSAGSVSAGLPAPEAPQRVDAGTFAAAVATPGITVIDVRTPEEFAAEHIDGAVNINVADPTFGTQVAALDPAKTYAVYCHSGNRSQTAVSQMSQAGFTHIYELQTGISGWTAAGYPTVS